MRLVKNCGHYALELIPRSGYLELSYIVSVFEHTCTRALLKVMHNGQQGGQDPLRNICSILCVHNTPFNSCATEYLEHSRTSTTSNLSDWSTIVYIVHQVQNIWSARAQEQRGARAQDQPLTSHESQPSELQGGWTVHTWLCALRICVFHILYFRYYRYVFLTARYGVELDSVCC